MHCPRAHRHIIDNHIGRVPSAHAGVDTGGQSWRSELAGRAEAISSGLAKEANEGTCCGTGVVAGLCVGVSLSDGAEWYVTSEHTSRTHASIGGSALIACRKSGTGRAMGGAVVDEMYCFSW